MNLGDLSYIFGSLMCVLCAVLLFRAHRLSRFALLAWSGWCFAGLALANALGFVDLALLPRVDLFPLRLGVTAAALLMLVWGLISGSEVGS